MRTAVVLLAAGAGLRVGSKIPKQFIGLGGEPLFMRSAHVFAGIPSVREIIVVSQPEFHKKIMSALRRLNWRGRSVVVSGGPFRGASVRNGVMAIASKPDAVLVHDAARPLVTSEIVARVERAAVRFGAALAAWPLPDSLKMARSDGRVKKTIPRKSLWLAQTPQGFRFDVAQKCLLKPSATATDDAELAERRGFPVRVVEGAATNFKVTYAADLALCRMLLS